jgi:thiamine-monophosphate kinase
MKDEFEFIKFLKRKEIKNPRVFIGIGDDSAAILQYENKYLLLTSDSLCEGVHFRREWMNLYEIGRKLILRGLSDIAACGGYPICANINLKIDERSLNKIEDFFDGVLDCAKEYNFSISGGDIVIFDKIIADVFFIGEVEKIYLTLRSGAKEGDILCITGNLGLSNLAIDILENKIDVPERIKKVALQKFYNPKIPLEKIRKILKFVKINSMIDVSDGLSKDLNHLSRESFVKIIIYEEKIPVAKEIFELKIENPYEYAINSGEEYELIFTIKEEDFEKIKDFDVKIIGKVEKGEGIYLKKISGEVIPIEIKGYDQFKKGNISLKFI